MRNLYRFLKKLGAGKVVYFLYLRVFGSIEYWSSFYRSKYKKTGRIVLYHRIASVSRDPHHLCVDPEIFEEQLRYFSSKYELVSLREIKKRAFAGSLSGKELAITFDDGYKDNLENALPLLEKYQAPATIFITTGYLGERASFAWDKEYLEEERGVFVNEKEILELAKHPLVAVGAHTVNHPNLASVGLLEQEKEIRESRLTLENITGGKISEFAFPFGGRLSHTRKTLKILKDENFDIACTTSENFVVKGVSSLRMPRFNMRSYTTEELADKLR